MLKRAGAKALTKRLLQAGAIPVYSFYYTEDKKVEKRIAAIA